MSHAATLTPDTFVADIVISNPLTARVFEHHHIDYCCHGKRPLSEACIEAGLDAGDVIAELALEWVHPDAASTPHDIGGLIGHIVSRHHAYLRRELPRLGALMAKVVTAHGAKHSEVYGVAALLSELTDELLPHLAKEEQVLFPLAIQLLGAVDAPTFHCGTVANPIRVMHVEHDRAGELLAALRRHTDGYQPPADACPTWRALYAGLAELEEDTHRHIHLENNVLFPAIEECERALSVSPA